MSRPKPSQRERGISFFREDFIEESSTVLVDRFLTSICNYYTDGLTQAQLRQIIETLNALVKNLSTSRIIPSNEPSFQCDQRLLQGLHLGLLSPSTALRAACARTLRYAATSPREFSFLLKLNTNIPISRCVDTVSQSSSDYFQVIRLISSLFRLASAQCSSRETSDFFAVVISSCCSAILQEPVQWQQNQKSPKQQLVIPRKLTAEIISEACLAASAPSSLPSPQMLHSLMAVALSESFYLSINEAIVGVFVHLLNYPHTRRALYSSGCLELLIAKFADDTVSTDPTGPGPNQQQNDDRGPTFQWKAAQFTLTKIFHSCPGAWALLGGNYCRELLNGLAPPMGFEPGADNGGYFITSRISSKRIKRQRELLSLLAAIFNIETPQWTTDISAAIRSTDPRKFNESWTVSEGFVAAEAEDLLYFTIPHRLLLANPPPDPASTLIALILAAFIEAHLVTALCTFSMSCLQYSFRGTKPSQKGGVVQLDPHFTEVECLGIQAAVILAHILHKAKRLLTDGSSAMDEIECCVASFHNNIVTAERQDVVRTIFDAISQTGALLSAAVNKPSSLHLELILRYCPKPTGYGVQTTAPTLPIFDGRPRSQSSSFNKQLLESTGLLTGVPAMDAITWPSIRLLLSLSPQEVRRSVSESDLVTAFRNLAAFYKSTGSFCHTDLSSLLRNGGRINPPKQKSHLPDIAHCAVSLIDFLLAGTETSSDSITPQSPSLGAARADYHKIAGDLISDICKTLSSVSTNPQCPAGENGAGYISVGSLPRVGAQFWFAIIGACTSTSYRQTLLEEHRSSAFDILRLFLNNSQSTEVMRLALSFLNFAVSEPSRQLLAIALKSPEDELRLYAVRLVTGLWQRIDDVFSFVKWAVPLITPLIADSQWRVSDSTVNALLDAVLLSPIAGSVIRTLKPAFRLNETSHRLLYGCCLVSPGAWQIQGQKEIMMKELELWTKDRFSPQYSKFCDEMFAEAFSGCFSRQPGGVEHYSNLKSAKKIRLPGRHFPPTIFKIMARSQLGVHFLGLKATDFVRQCCEIVTYYANADMLVEPKYSSEIVASIRSSMCVLANISSNPLGADWLGSSPSFDNFNIIAAFHSLARNSPVFSIRGTALIALSVVADCVDPEFLFDCQWVDPKRRANLVSLADNPKPTHSPAVSRKATLLSIPDISVAPPIEMINSSPYDMQRRSSSADMPLIPFEPSSLSSSSSSSISSTVIGQPEAIAVSRGASLPVQHSPLVPRTSLPVNVQRGFSITGEVPHSPKSPKKLPLNRLSNFFKRSTSKQSSTGVVVYDHGQDSAFFPTEKTRTMTEASQNSLSVPGPREKSVSIDVLGQSGSSLERSGSIEPYYPAGENNGSPRSLDMLDMEDVKVQRSPSLATTLNADQSKQRPVKKAFFLATAETTDSSLASSVFYLPMEETSTLGQVVTGVFLPQNVGDLLQDPMMNVPGFKPDLPLPPTVPRKMSVVSMSTNSQSGNNKAGTNEVQQLFPPGEASNIINEHSSQCLICCRSDTHVKVAVTDEWQQVLWLVVSLQIWPNRTPKMLLSYFANNRHLANDGCLYSEVVNLMSKLALPRLSRQFVHSLFDTMSFPPLVVAARELNPSVV